MGKASCLFKYVPTLLLLRLALILEQIIIIIIFLLQVKL